MIFLALVGLWVLVPIALPALADWLANHDKGSH